MLAFSLFTKIFAKIRNFIQCSAIFQRKKKIRSGKREDLPEVWHTYHAKRHIIGLNYLNNCIKSPKRGKIS